MKRSTKWLLGIAGGVVLLKLWATEKAKEIGAGGSGGDSSTRARAEARVAPLGHVVRLRVARWRRGAPSIGCRCGPDGFALASAMLSAHGVPFVAFASSSLAQGHRVFVSPSPLFDDGGHGAVWSLYLDAPPASAFGAFDEVTM